MLGRNAGDTVTAVFDADLVAAGLRGPAGDGSVRSGRAGGGRVLCIGLRGQRSSVLELPYEPVAALLQAPVRTGRSGG